MKRTNAFALLLAVIFAGFTWWALSLRDKLIIEKGLPPGFYLECDSKGKHRVCYEELGRPLMFGNPPASKAEALRRAWSQFEHERAFDLECAGIKVETNGWKRCP